MHLWRQTFFITDLHPHTFLRGGVIVLLHPGLYDITSANDGKHQLRLFKHQGNFELLFSCVFMKALLSCCNPECVFPPLLFWECSRVNEREFIWGWSVIQYVCAKCTPPLYYVWEIKMSTTPCINSCITFSRSFLWNIFALNSMWIFPLGKCIYIGKS